MAEKLLIQSTDHDNRITTVFPDSSLPRLARQGELYVVNGILYIFGNIDGGNRGKWFPLTDEKSFYSFDSYVPIQEWQIPVDFNTTNFKVLVYGTDEKIYLKDFETELNNGILSIKFTEEVAGTAHIILNKSIDWLDKRLIIGDRNFVCEQKITDPSIYSLEINTDNFKLDKDGNLTISGLIIADGQVVFDGTGSNNPHDLTISGNLQVDGNVNIDGVLTIHGSDVRIQTNTLTVEDNIITLNKNNFSGIPKIGLEAEIEGTNIAIFTYDSSTKKISIPTIINGEQVEDEVATKSFVLGELSSDTLELSTNLNTEINRAKNSEAIISHDLISLENRVDTVLSNINALELSTFEAVLKFTHEANLPNNTSMDFDLWPIFGEHTDSRERYISLKILDDTESSTNNMWINGEFLLTYAIVDNRYLKILNESDKDIIFHLVVK